MKTWIATKTTLIEMTMIVIMTGCGGSYQQQEPGNQGPTVTPRSNNETVPHTPTTGSDAGIPAPTADAMPGSTDSSTSATPACIPDKDPDGHLCGCQGLPCCYGTTTHGTCNGILDATQTSGWDGVLCFGYSPPRSGITLASGVCLHCGGEGEPCCLVATDHLPGSIPGSGCGDPVTHTQNTSICMLNDSNDQYGEKRCYNCGQPGLECCPSPSIACFFNEACNPQSDGTFLCASK